jgi:hypothetical protein
MASSPSPTTPRRAVPAQSTVARPVEIVWGAPSNEMLEAEARGEIILVEDIYRRPAEQIGTHDGGSTD